jgi:hypothetical protein
MSDLPPTPDPSVAIAATFTVEPVLPCLDFLLSEAGLPLELECAAYNQVFQELLSSTGLLSANDGGVNVVLIRI